MGGDDEGLDGECRGAHTFNVGLEALVDTMHYRLP